MIRRVELGDAGGRRNLVRVGRAVASVVGFCVALLFLGGTASAAVSRVEVGTTNGPGVTVGTTWGLESSAAYSDGSAFQASANSATEFVTLVGSFGAAGTVGIVGPRYGSWGCATGNEYRVDGGAWVAFSNTGGTNAPGSVTLATVAVPAGTVTVDVRSLSCVVLTVDAFDLDGGTGGGTTTTTAPTTTTTAPESTTTTAPESTTTTAPESATTTTAPCGGEGQDPCPDAATGTVQLCLPRTDGEPCEPVDAGLGTSVVMVGGAVLGLALARAVVPPERWLT